MNIPKTQDDVNQQLLRLCEIDIEISAIGEEMYERIALAKSAAERLVNPLKKERAAVETAIKTWFRVYRKTMGNRKSLKFLFGTVKAADETVSIELDLEALKGRS